jgi:glycosyltransferase involved in cell wall biosynthesis
MPDGISGGRQPVRVLALGVNWFSEGSGGLDRVFHDLATAFPQAGIDMHGLVLGPPDAAASTGGRITAFGRGGPLPMRLLQARRAISAALAAHDPDVVAIHFALFGLPALDVLHGRRVTVHFHGPWADEAAEEGAGWIGVKIRRAVEGAVYRRANRVIALSQAFAATLKNTYAVDPGRIVVVPGSVDIERFAPRMSREAARAALGWPAQARIILAVRRLVRRMGLDRLIEAMPSICAAVPDAMLMIAGRGAEAARLKALAHECGVADRIRFLGFLPEDDLPLAYRAAEINVVPSRALEGFGLTAAESLAAGTPSIVTPIGGLPEVVLPLSEKLVFHSAERPDIEAGLIAALSHALPDAAACIDYAERHFAPARAACDVGQVYREAAFCPAS